MAKKYRVAADEQFLGHYYGKCPEEAIEKAIRANFNYRPELLGMPDCEFTTIRDLNVPEIFTWSDVPHLMTEFEIPGEE